MQIFFIDTNPVAAARALCDTHVVKMPVEALQLLATAHHRLGWPPPLKVDGTPYKPIKQGKELADWVCEADGNRRWLVNHALACCMVYAERYGKTHGAQAEIGKMRRRYMDRPAGEPTPFPRRWSTGAPVEVLDAIGDTVEAYREYYRWKVASKPGRFRWVRGECPGWVMGEHGFDPSLTPPYITDELEATALRKGWTPAGCGSQEEYLREQHITHIKALRKNWTICRVTLQGEKKSYNSVEEYLTDHPQARELMEVEG